MLCRCSGTEDPLTIVLSLPPGSAHYFLQLRLRLGSCIYLCCTYTGRLFSSTVKNPSHPDYWKDIKLLAFDAPLLYFSDYAERIMHLKACIPTPLYPAYACDIAPDNPVAKVLTPIPVSSMEQVSTRLMIHNQGLIFKRPISKYMEQYYVLQP